MKRHHPLFILLAGALLIGLLVASCTSTPPDPPEAAPGVEEPAGEEHTEEGEEQTEEGEEHTEEGEEHTEEELVMEGDAVRGGLMWDKWWVVIAASEAEEHEHEGDDHEATGEAPEGDHPLWSTQSTNERSGPDTWRCKECHGWDYKGVDGAYGSGSHTTGFPGVIQLAGGDPAEILATLQGSTSPDHDFSAYMEEQDLVDISQFISEFLVDDADFINADTTSLGDATAGEELYSEVCTLCHGPDGNAIDFHGFDDPEFVGHISSGNPWEFIHKVRFGQPGWPMPSSINNEWTNEDVADVLAYAQTFTTDAPLSGAGQMYDKWWVVTEQDVPEGDHPLWASQDTNTREGPDTWRCKECHGWDYMGVDGAYGSGSHLTGFAGVLGASGKSADEILGWLDGTASGDHDFAQFMDELALAAMVQFIQEEAVDITPYVNADGTVNGDPLAGRELYEGTCSNCHGVDGTAINFHDADDPEYIGTVAAGNPWETFHKISFGQPGAPMPVGLALGWSLEDITSVIAYAQTLPTE